MPISGAVGQMVPPPSADCIATHGGGEKGRGGQQVVSVLGFGASFFF